MSLDAINFVSLKQVVSPLTGVSLRNVFNPLQRRQTEASPQAVPSRNYQSMGKRTQVGWDVPVQKHPYQLLTLTHKSGR
jgi:hypothetical protein